MPSSPLRPTSRRGALGFITAGVAAPWLPPSPALADPAALTPACGRTLTPPEMEGPFFRPQSPERSDLAQTVGEGLPLILAGRVLDSCGRPVAGALIDVWQANAHGAYDERGYALRGHQFTGADRGYPQQTIAPRWYAKGPGGPPPEGRWGHPGPPPFGPPPFGGLPEDTSGDRLTRLGPPPGRLGGPPGGGLRTPHIHLKVQAPGGPVLTTQLFLPDELSLYGRAIGPLNRQDGLFRPDLVIQTAHAAEGLQGRFDLFVATRT